MVPNSRIVGTADRTMVGRKMTAGCRAGGDAARRRPSRHGGIFSKLSIIAGFGCFLGVFAGFRNQDSIRTGSGSGQDSVRIASGPAFRRKVFADRLLDGKRHRGKRHLMFCSLRFLSVVFCLRVLDNPALVSPGRTAAWRKARTGDLLSGDNISPYIYLIDALCEFSKILLSHPVPRALWGPREDAASVCAPRGCGDASGRRKNIFPVN